MRFPQAELGLQSTLETVYPVGSIFASVVNTNPATLLGFGTWAAFASGRCLVGVDAGDADFDAPEKTGGAKTVTLDATQIPGHTHPSTSDGGTIVNNGAGNAVATVNQSGATGVFNTNQNAGGGQAHQNMPPFITCFLWKRTA